ncbi:MFS transporter [Photobacterium leiognathi]|uniref:MFS transporter n=1 Tax=Photobacterium leiognathi TaxID=553611 RepID=UPI002739B990|nr:MFS transporter [Photobacterium leiognathi]
MFKDIIDFDKPTKFFLLSTFMMGLSNGLFDSIYNFYLEENGLDKGDIGNIYAFSMLFMSISVIPLIFLNRNFSTKKILIISSLLYSASICGIANG